MSLLVPRVPAQDELSPPLQQDLCITCIATAGSREARCSKFLGDTDFSYLARTAETGCGQKKKEFFVGYLHNLVSLFTPSAFTLWKRC